MISWSKFNKWARSHQYEISIKEIAYRLGMSKAELEKEIG